MTASPELVQERHGQVLLLRLNRPEVRNALSWSLIDRLGASVTSAESDPETRAVVITGTGERAFCSGEDLRSLAAGQTPPPVHRGFLRLVDGHLSVPVVAAVNATAVAAGFEILLGCHLVVASTEARFGLPEVKRGLVAGAGLIHIAHRLPLAVALEMTLTGDPLDARRAHELGLVNLLTAPERVVGTALAVAEEIARRETLPVDLGYGLGTRIRYSGGRRPTMTPTDGARGG